MAEHLPKAGPPGSGAAGRYVEHTPEAEASPELIEEIGDLLFAVVNLARKAGVAPGSRSTRPTGSSSTASAASSDSPPSAGVDLHSAGLAKLDALWDEVKAGGG